MAKPELKPEGEVAAKVKLLPAKDYTYVGGGEDSPRKINFMGMQEFIRGKMVSVTDQRVLQKLANHQCFVEGEVKMEDLHDYDEEAAKDAEKKRVAAKKVNAAYTKKHKTVKEGEEE